MFTRLSLYYFLSVPDQYLSFPPLKCIHFQGPVKYHFLYEAVTDFQQKISWQWLPLGCHSLLFILLHSSHYFTTPPYSVLCILLCSSPLLITDRKGWFYLFLSLHSVFLTHSRNLRKAHRSKLSKITDSPLLNTVAGAFSHWWFNGLQTRTSTSCPPHPRRRR